MTIAKDFSDIHVLVTVQFSLSNTRFPPRSTSRTSALHSYCVTTVFAATVAFHRRECFVTGGSFLVLHRLVVILIVCTGPWVGARCVPAGFSRKGWATTPSYALISMQPSRLHDTPPNRRHTRARASSPRSMPTRVRLVMSQANGLNILLSPRCMYS